MYGVPALLSFVIPGLGQLIKGHWLRTIAIWLVILILLLYLAIGGKPVIATLGFIVLWLWQLTDAYRTPARAKPPQKTQGD